NAGKLLALGQHWAISSSSYGAGRAMAMALVAGVVLLQVLGTMPRTAGPQRGFPEQSSRNVPASEPAVYEPEATPGSVLAKPISQASSSGWTRGSRRKAPSASWPAGCAGSCSVGS